MITYSLRGQLQPSRDAAVAAAIGAAMSDYKGLAENVHIHVLQLIQVGEFWQAVIQIGLEPDLTKELEEKKTQEKEKHEKLVEEQKPKDDHPPDQMPGEEKEEEKPPGLEMPKEEPSVHIFIPNLFEPGDLYEPHHYKDHPNYYFHFLEPDSSFWKASLKITPDIDLYESAQEAVVTGLVSEPAHEPKAEPKPEPRSKKKKLPSLSLGEEL